MHLDEWDRYRYLTEFFRVLGPGGVVYVDNFDLAVPRGGRSSPKWPRRRGQRPERQQGVDAAGTHLVRRAPPASPTCRTRGGNLWITGDRAQAGPTGYAGGRGLKP